MLDRGLSIDILLTLYICDGGLYISDDKANRGAQDRSRISLSEDYEVRYWTEALGVSKERLEELFANTAIPLKR